jgi:hypothetical protein
MLILDIQESSFEQMNNKTVSTILEIETKLPQFKRTEDEKYNQLSHYPHISMSDGSIIGDK